MRIKNYYLNRLARRITLSLKPSRIKIHEEKNNLNQPEKVILDQKIKINLKETVIGLVRDSSVHPYYTKFERFLKNNNILYDYFDIHANSWIEGAKIFDVIIWRPGSSPWEIEEAREKIYVLERVLNKFVYLSYDEIIYYENKIFQYYILKNLGVPVIETFISFDYDEVVNWIQKTEYPIVSKVRTCSASHGVILLRSEKQAKKYTEKVFRTGFPHYWPFLKQKNYVFFQKYIKNKGFDLRVIIIDEHNIFGYYREVPKGDFRASGRGRVVKKEIPKGAIKIALDITKKLKFTNLSVDFLQSIEDNKLFVIETSNFITVASDEQLKVQSIPGKYSYDQNSDHLVFEKGRYWIQEVILKKFFEKHFSVNFI